MDSNEKVINVKISKTNIKLNQKVNVCLEISGDFGFVNEAKILINTHQNKYNKQEKLNYVYTQNNINIFTCNLSFENTGLYYFYIQIIIDGKENFIKYDRVNNKAVLTNSEMSYWTITAYDCNFETPDWAKGKVMYHIFVDRFYRSNVYKPAMINNRVTKKWGELPEWNIDAMAKYNNTDFFMGNLKGIEEKIPYLKKLGVKILYLSPICKSQSNHRYDVADYELIDPYLGDNKHLKELCVKAHRNGMKVILDGVFNHTGNDSKYFNEYCNYDTIGAYQSKNSVYYKWYKKNCNGDFEYWWGFKNLPVCDGNNLEWQNFIYGKNGIIDKWFKMGIDGLRLDVADELTDEFIENIRKAVKRNKKDGFIVGEVWENAITKEKEGMQRKYLLGNGLDSVMNYPFTNAILKYVRFGDYKYFKTVVNEIIEQYPIETLNCLMNSLSTHDITRAITTLVGQGIDENNNLIWDTQNDRKWQLENEKLTDEQYNLAKQMFKIATIIQYFLPGNSCIYYGDEIGMYGYRDPFNRKCFNWDCIDEELHDFYVDLGKIKDDVFFENAKFKILHLDYKLLIFERYNNDNSVIVIVNRSNDKIDLEFMEKEIWENVIYQYNFNENIIDGMGYAIIWNKK